MTAASADLRQLAKDLDYASGMGIKKASKKVVRDTAYKTQRLASSFAPVDTGLLSRTIVIRFPSETEAVVHPMQPYAVYQEFGTGQLGEFAGAPVRRKDGLSFQVNGRRVTATRRGHRAQPFMRPAVVEALKPAAAELARTGALLITQGPRAVQ